MFYIYVIVFPIILVLTYNVFQLQHSVCSLIPIGHILTLITISNYNVICPFQFSCLHIVCFLDFITYPSLSFLAFLNNFLSSLLKFPPCFFNYNLPFPFPFKTLSVFQNVHFLPLPPASPPPFYIVTFTKLTCLTPLQARMRSDTDTCLNHFQVGWVHPAVQVGVN